MCIGLLPVCVSANLVHALCPVKSEKGIRSAGTRVIDRSELPNPGPLDEQLVLLTTMLSLHPLIQTFKSDCEAIPFVTFQ